MRTNAARRCWSDVGSPRFRRGPFVRDGVFDLGRATAPRITVSHASPSTALKVSASTILLLTRLNSLPRTIAVYASLWSLPSTTQHSLPGWRYPLPGPDFHRLDRASFSWRTTVQFAGQLRLHRGDGVDRFRPRVTASNISSTAGTRTRSWGAHKASDVAMRRPSDSICAIVFPMERPWAEYLAGPLRLWRHLAGLFFFALRLSVGRQIPEIHKLG